MRWPFVSGMLPLTASRSNARYVAASILLCVTVLVAVAATAILLRQAMEINARQLLGADLRLQASWPLPAAEEGSGIPTALLQFAQHHLAGPGRRFSPGLEFAAMLRVAESDRSLLVEVKAVDEAYPLRGQLLLEQEGALQAALQEDGVVVEAGLLQRLDLHVGDAIELGEARFTIRGVLAVEPDRITRLFRLGPRILMPLHRVAATGLLQKGSRVTQVVGVALAAGEQAAEVAHGVRALALQQGIRLFTPEQSQPSVRRFVRRFTLFLGMTALLTLLLSGLAIATALSAWIRENRRNIAILKLLGADHRQVSGQVLAATLAMSWPASLSGALLGSALPALMPYLMPELLPAEVGYRPSLGLAVAGAAFGLLFSLLCVLAPLLWSRRLSPAALFQVSAGSDALRHPPERHLLSWGLLLLLVTALAVAIGVWSGEKRAGWLFALGLGATLAVAWLSAQGVLWLLRRWPHGPLPWRLACQALLRRGERQALVLMALAIALGLVDAVLFLENNLNQQLINRLPQRIPSFFFIDLQPDQVEPFRQLARRYALPQEESVRMFPTVRGRLQHDNPLAIEEDPDQSRTWRQAREYVLTFAEQMPLGNRLLSGQWWSHADAREASVEVELAKEMGWQLGDSIAFTVQGVTVAAKIRNLRAVRWSDFGLNFFVLFSPAVLQDLPYAWLATVAAEAGQEEHLLAEVNRQLPNVTAVATRQVLTTMQGLLQQVATAAQALGVVAVLAGVLLLGVQVTASRRRRIREMAIYRLIGATSAELARILAAEMAIIALVATGMAVGIGYLLTVLVVRGLFNEVAVLDWLPTVLAGVGGGGVIFLAGWLASLHHLQQPVMRVLRTAEG
ncbi:MAG: FtsX-like permease family protein [Magnetococcales bacterium]|nr:FtsX-like permease family protein [Magnetococcales bacterium]